MAYKPSTSSGYSTVQNEGSGLTARSTIDFVGAGVTASDTGSKTQVSIPGGAGEAFPVGSVFIAVVSTNPSTLLGYGTWSAFAAGRVLVGLDSGDTDFDLAEETGGAKTVASAGTVSQPTFTGSEMSTHQHAAVSAGTPSGTNAAESTHTHSVTSNVAVDDHASHTHTYTDVVNHTHSVNVGSAADTSTVTGAGNIFAGTTSSVVATAANPAGGVATGTTAGPSATLTHSVTNNAVTSGAGASHNHTFTGDAMGTHQHAAITAGTPAGTVSQPTFTGSATSVVQPYIVVYMWKRTA